MNIEYIREKGNKLVDDAVASIAHQFRSNYALCWIIGGLMVIISLAVRSTMYVEGDTGFYFFRASQILAGKKYYDDFFEPNFPLNFYIYTIPVMLTHVFGIGKIAALTIFVTIIQLTSIVCCVKLIKRTSIYSDGILYNLFIITLFWGHFLPLFNFPINQFGTKTVLFFSFIAPYFFYTLCEIENKPLSARYSILIGIFAGLTVCLKPDYALLLVFIEAYVMLQKRDFRYLFRPINWAILVTNIVHLVWLIVFVPEYVFKVIPMLTVSYPQETVHFITKLYYVAIHPQIYPLVLIALFYIRSKRTSITDILVISVIATTLIRGLHGINSLDQGMIPIFFIGLTIAKIISDIVQRKITLKLYEITIVCTCFLIITEALIMCYVQVQPKKENFADQLVTVSREVPPDEYVYAITKVAFAFLIPMYVDVKTDNKIGNVYLLEGVEESLIAHPNDEKTPLILKTRSYLFNSFVEGVTKHHPKLIFIDDGGLELMDRCLEDYVTYFSRSEAFRDVWKDYDFYKRLKNKGATDILVFKRRDDNEHRLSTQ